MINPAGSIRISSEGIMKVDWPFWGRGNGDSDRGLIFSGIV